jgi:peptide deformylase
VRPIRYLGDPVLRRPAKRVTKVDDSIRRLVEDMIESMYVAQGVGLAAPQIGVSLQIAVLAMPEQPPFAIINPDVVAASGTREMEAEGCLSVPGYRAALRRSQEVTVSAIDAEGEQITIHAEGDLLAEALEHEVDHLHGRLYVDHVARWENLMKLEGSGWVAVTPDGAPAEDAR